MRMRCTPDSASPLAGHWSYARVFRSMMRVRGFGFDPQTPSVARVYDYLLGGKDHLAVDREVGKRLVAVNPEAREVVAENRRFLARAVAWAARQGIRQFIDLACGMPAEPGTHETAQAACDGARVAYVDLDPVALAHLRAFAEHGNEAVTVASGDARDAAAVIQAVSAGIDVTAPVCLLLGCLLHFFPADEARALVAGYAAALAPGSCVVVSVARGAGPRVDKFFRTYSGSATPIYNHPEAVIAGFFGPLPLVPPGLVDARQWRPDAAETQGAVLREAQMIAGVAQVNR
jgi:S-adenosyl methyltransferase